LTLVVAAFLGWVRYEVNCAQEEEEAAAAIGALGGSARRVREIRIGADDGLACRIVLRLPERVRSFLGDRFLDPVVRVDFPEGCDDEPLGVLDHFHHVEEVWLRGARLTPEGFQRVFGHRGLVALFLDGATITDEDVAGLRSLTRLEGITLDHTSVSDCAVETLATLPKLTGILLRGTRVTAEGIQPLREKEASSGLSLDWSRAPSEAARETAAALVQAGVRVGAYGDENGLATYDVFYDDKALRGRPPLLSSLSNLANLRELTFARAPSNTYSLNDEELDQVRRLSTVERLRLWEARLDRDGWDRLTRPIPDPHVGQTPALRGLRDLEIIGDVDLAGISRLTQLEALMIYGKSATDAELRYLESLCNLRRLALWPKPGASSWMVSDAGLRHLAGLVRLEWLSLARASQIKGPGLVHLGGLTRLEDLDLSDTAVDDASLVHLAPLKNLQHLDLTGTRVTDAGVKHLLGFRRLVWLDLPKSVSPEAIAELKASLPDARILTR